MFATAKWDFEKAKKLYDAGASYVEIAKACKTTKKAVYGYAKRNWPDRELDKQKYAEIIASRTAEKSRKAQLGRSAELNRGKATLPPLESLTFDD